MICPKCGAKMRCLVTIDDHWREWQCKCGHKYFGLKWEKNNKAEAKRLAEGNIEAYDCQPRIESKIGVER